jgi:transcriptional regulator
MYTPRHFAIDDIAAAHAVMEQNSFALLVTFGEGGLAGTHLPVMLDRSLGPFGTVRAHVARANPQWRDFDGECEAMLVFAGQHGYISPSWYEPGPAVPTWDYVTVHAYGAPRVIEDAATVQAMLRELVDQYESRYAAPWSVDSQSPEYLERMAKGIIAFEMEITRLDAKAKLGQNRPEQQAGVARALEEVGAHELARLVREANGIG